MGVGEYFFDTYAFFEILIGNPAYRKYAKDVGIATTKMNLLELHYGVLNASGKELADAKYREYLPFSVEITDEAIRKASLLRHSMKKRKLSYVDCLGYVIARMHGIPFLTGDRQFKDLENVEFVK